MTEPTTSQPTGAANTAAVQRSFSNQASAFEDPTRAFANRDVAAWMKANTPTHPSDLVLEVAAGTALFGRALAPDVRTVIAIDITTQMLETGRHAATDEGLSNIVFQTGDATFLTFLDDSFDRVVSRLAIHHFVDPGVVIGEMARVCRRSGTVTVIDMVVPDAAEAPAFNHLERRRDPAHTRALTREELRSTIEAAGLEIVHTSTWENLLEGERWLEQTNTPPADAEAIRAAWTAEIQGGPRTGMEPRMSGDRIEFVHHWDLLVAKPTDGAHARRRSEP